MKTVRLGIVGVGNMGSVHAVSVKSGMVDGMELACVCDVDEKKLAWAKETLGVTRFSDYRQMIDSGCIDAVLIATPHYLHSEIAIYAFNKGLHVLTEKPAGVYVRQSEEMNVAAKRAGTVFGIMYNQRTNPIFAKMREIVRTGGIGEPKRLVWIITNWYRTQHYYNSGGWRATWGGEGGGVLINQCPHNIDLWQWIFGMPSSIYGHCQYGKYHNIEVEDDVTAYAEYDNGATAVFITTTGEYPGTNRLEITGDLAKMVAENNTLKIWSLKEPERQFCFQSQDNTVGYVPEYSEFSPNDDGSGHNGILQNFTYAILKNEPLLAPGYEGFNGLSISNAIHLSDWTGQPVKLPVDQLLFEKLLNEKIESSSKNISLKSDINYNHGTHSTRWNTNW